MPKETVRRRGERGKREKRKNSSSKATGAGKIKATWQPGSTPRQRPASEKQSSLPAALSFLIPPAPAEHSPPNLRPIGHPHWAKTPIDVIRACPIRQYVNTGTQPRAGQSARTPLSFSLPRLVAGYTPSVPYRGVAIAVGARAESTGDPPSSRLAHAPLPRHRRYVSRQACACVANRTLLLLLMPSRASSVRVLLPLLLSAIRLRHAPNQRRRAVVPCVGSSHSCASNGAGLDPSDETPRLPVVANGPPHRAGVFPAAARHHQCSALLCSAITNGSLPGRHNCGPTQTLI